MSFGQRTSADNRTYRRPTENFTPRPKKQSNNDSVFASLLPGLGVFIAIIAVGGLAMFVERPFYTYSVAKFRYNQFDLVASSMGTGMIAAAKKRFLQRVGIDFSTIFTPARSETTMAMKHVASRCLPANGFKQKVMPDRGHNNFAKATRYLSCAMNTRVERLCQPSERKRLVAQLMQYLTLRQQMFAVEKARSRMFGGRRAQQQNQHMMKMAAIVTGKHIPSLESRNPKIGTQLDGRIAHRLTNLAKNGYISASDFSWMGLSAPKVYAPLIKNATTPRSCRA